MKEKEKINEIAHFICKSNENDICLLDNCRCNCDCGWVRFAQTIYKEYLKRELQELETQVREETAKKIFEELRDKKRGFYIHFSLMEEYEFDGILNEVEKQCEVKR